MAAKHKGNKRFKEKDEWQEWVESHQKLIDASGLPLLYVSTEEHWSYFLDHGTLFYFEEDFPDFSLRNISICQQAALARLVILRGGLTTVLGYDLVVSMLDRIDVMCHKKSSTS